MGGSFAGVKVANRGISGDTTRGVLIRLKEDVLSLKPSGIVLLIGTNDLGEKAAPEVIAGNLKLILAAIKKHNAKTPIFLCNVMPSSASKNRPAAQIKKINQLKRALFYHLVRGIYPNWLWLFPTSFGKGRLERF
jgi:lysophospholipase L1-like esterase